MKRILTAVVFLPIFTWIVGRPPWVYFLLLAAALLVSIGEVGRLVRGRGVRFPTVVAGIAALGILFVFLDPRIDPIAAVGLALVVLPIALLPGSRSLERSVASIGITLIAVVSLGVLIGFQMWIRVLGERLDQHLVFFFFLVIWAGDTGAYYVGRTLGRRPLWPQVSPNKTVEGSIGGALAGLLAGAGGAAWILNGISLWQGMALGVVLNGFGQFGDLLESSCKRVSGVKDSAALLPGHGGLLDRLDSLLVAGPVFYLFCLFRFGAG